MANGVYGSRKPALITSNDVDIFYNYRPSRSSSDVTDFIQLDSGILTTTNAKDASGNDLGVLTGAYNLRLPLDKFGKKGIYNIYIKPKEVKATIIDVSTLSAYPDVRGIVLNINSLSSISNASANNSLIGYRVEYYDANGNKEDIFRIITSNNKCEPLAQNLNNSLQKNLTYRFNDSSNLFFCTLTPSTSQSFNSANLPFIGETNQTISLVNTKFNPVMMEIEMVEHDIETISTMLEGDQLRDLSAGLITTFNSDGSIYHQSVYANAADASKGIHHDIKLNNRDNIIDQTGILTEIKDNL